MHPEYLDEWVNNLPPGWHDLYDKMCHDLKELIHRYEAPHDVIVILDVKEKFGGLRFYYHLNYPDAPPQFISDVENIIMSYYTKSVKTCNECGQTATRHCTDWILPICDRCATEEYFRRYPERGEPLDYFFPLIKND